jgi:hypothetical protein
MSASFLGLRAVNINEDLLERIQCRHAGERVRALGCQMRLRMRGGDDGQIPAQGGLNLLVKVVAVLISCCG